jgi:hypothetical protein
MSSVEESAQLKVHDKDVLANLSGSCKTIFGSPINLKVCYSYDSSTESVSVSVTLDGHKMGDATLSASNPSAKFSLSVEVVKASIALSFDPQSQCLSYEAQGCYKDIFKKHGWKCATKKGKIACF